MPERPHDLGGVVDNRVEGYLPLRGYALLGDGRTCALVACDGAVDWWALPRMADAPPFGAILDAAAGGRVSLRPTNAFDVSREYVADGGVLATTFRTATGEVRVTDALTTAVDGPLPWAELARRVECLDGEVPMVWQVAPGDMFGTAAAWARRRDGTPLVSVGGVNLAVVADGVGALRIAAGTVGGSFTVRAGDRGLLAVTASAGPFAIPQREEIERRVDETVSSWSRWRGTLRYDGPWAAAVCRSAIVLKQLTYSPSGTVQAAATTSLPERLGGGRTFDYRFCWVRDAGFAMDALTTLGLRAQVHASLSALLAAVSKTAPDLRVFYTIDGDVVSARQQAVRLWDGYRHTVPVRVGNDAANQTQLGAYGDLLESVWRYAEHGNALDGATGRLVLAVADRVCEQWDSPDAGLWELGDRQHYTSSKIGCWAALDRAARLVDRGQVPADHVHRWRAVAEQIHDFVDTACWSAAKRSYTFFAGSDDLDCATLLAARTGFCDRDDPRLATTVDAIRRELAAGGPLLYRYSGMRGEEGAFVACSFWLVEALAHIRRSDEAHELMDATMAEANDVGLLSEEIDPADHQLLGNFPQALSHLALISAAAACGNEAD